MRRKRLPGTIPHFEISWIRLVFIAAFLIQTAPIHASVYLWPTDASRYLTSSFGEYRVRHFHFGIDIKTWGKDGYKVFAARDGWVTRVRVSPFGYGRAVYVKHPDGYSTVYGHLSGFAPKIAGHVRGKQKRLMRYSVELNFADRQVPVKQGEIIAYSGHSGVGLPHLHFEIRDSADRPRNPLLYNLGEIDSMPAVPVRIAFIPLDARSTVEGDWKPEIFTPVPQGNARFVLNEIPELWGNIGIAADCFDSGHPDVSNKFSPYSIILQVDGNAVFNVEYSRTSFATDHLIELDRDYRLLRRGFGIFHKLFIDEGNSLPIYKRYPEKRDIIPAFRAEDGGIGTGDHRFSIILNDVGGNVATLDGIFRVSQENAITLDDLVKGTAIPEASSSGPGDAPAAGSDLLEIQDDWYDAYVRFQISSKVPLSGTPKVSLSINDRPARALLVKKRGERKFVAAYPLIFPDIRNLKCEVSASTPDGKTIRKIFETPLQAVANSGGEIISADGNCRVIFHSGTLFRTLWGRIVPATENRHKFQVGGQYTVIPGDVPVDDAPELAMTYPSGDANPSKLGIYFHAGNRWRHISGRRDPQMRAIRSRINGLDTFTLIRDTVPPEFQNLLPVDGSVTDSKRPLLRVVIKDALSGLGSDDLLEMRLDGGKVIAEYDPEDSALFYVPEADLRAGSHILEISAMDNMENKSSIKSTFTVRQ